MKKSLLIAFTVITVAFASCERQPEITPVYPEIEKAEGGVFILNEGNFQFGNAGLDYINFETQKASMNVFETVNKRQLGDVLQSMTSYNNTAYLVVNNSQKIEAINMKTFVSTGTISGFKSPRYMLVVSPTKAYVSEYYNGGIKLVDPSLSTITSAIQLKGNLDEMNLIGTKLYVANSNGNYLYIIDVNTDQVSDSIEVGFGANSMRVDANGKLWVLCAGRTEPYLSGNLVRINPSDNSIEQKLAITRQSEHGPMKLRINKNGRSLYWINKDVYKHDITSNSVSLMPWITSLGNNFWALGFDTVNNEVYVGDAVDYVQKSSILRYNESAGMKGSFKAGIITGDFYFNYAK